MNESEDNFSIVSIFTKINEVWKTLSYNRFVQQILQRNEINKFYLSFLIQAA